jgi:hypothetical protein
MSANKENAPAGPASASGTIFAGTSEKLLDLASRCEKATGPDDKLDWDIAIVSNGFDPEYPLPYTASLDAAMTLVPEGHEWLKLSPFTASIYRFVEDDKEWAKHIEAKGNTFPLALCAAALKARTHKEEAS